MGLTVSRQTAKNLTVKKGKIGATVHKGRRLHDTILPYFHLFFVK